MDIPKWFYTTDNDEISSATTTTQDNSNLTRIEFFVHRYWVDPNDNQQTFVCTATEYIDFTADGLIQHIGYITHPSQPEPVADYPTIVDETTTTPPTTLY